MFYSLNFQPDFNEIPLNLVLSIIDTDPTFDLRDQEWRIGWQSPNFRIFSWLDGLIMAVGMAKTWQQFFIENHEGGGRGHGRQQTNNGPGGHTKITAEQAGRPGNLLIMIRDI
jgi:hypothetical protein